MHPTCITYDSCMQLWDHIRAGRQASNSKMAIEEKDCFNDMWQADNLPLISDGTKAAKRPLWKAVISNIVFIVMQSLLQLPALFTFVWYLVNIGAGSIAYTSDAQSSWKNLASTQFRQAFVLFMVYAAGAILWQVLAFKMPARKYLLAASIGYFFSCVASVWATYIVQVWTSLLISRAYHCLGSTAFSNMCLCSTPADSSEILSYIEGWHQSCSSTCSVQCALRVLSRDVLLVWIQAASPLYLATFVAAPASGPVIGFIFADQRNQISVSEYGPAVMGVSDGMTLSPHQHKKIEWIYFLPFKSCKLLALSVLF